MEYNLRINMSFKLKSNFFLVCNQTQPHISGHHPNLSQLSKYDNINQGYLGSPKGGEDEARKVTSKITLNIGEHNRVSSNTKHCVDLEWIHKGVREFLVWSQAGWETSSLTLWRY